MRWELNVPSSFVPSLEKFIPDRQRSSLVGSKLNVSSKTKVLFAVAHLIEVESLSSERSGHMSHDVIGDLLYIVRIGLLLFQSFLPGSFVANRPFALDVHTRLRREIRP